MKRIKNLKYDPNHADKPMSGYSHLEYLDDIFTIEQAQKTIAYEKKHGSRTMEIVEIPKKDKKKSTKSVAPDLKIDKDDLNESDS